MVYLRRKIDVYLKNWKERKDKKPLIIKGARQIGKTESIKKFGVSNYKNVVYINFVESPEFKSIIDNGFKTDDIIKNISLIDSSSEFEEGETLIFFDEVQDFPNICTSLKFFKIDGRFDVVCSGSLLGINYKTIDSISVGYKWDYTMMSMDFEEFLWAKGYSDEQVNDIYSHIKEKKPFSTVEETVYSKLFQEYCLVGGMPEIVNTFISNNTYEGILERQKQLLEEYKSDIRKYTIGTEQSRIMNVFNRIAVQLGTDNKKFQISKVAHNAKSKDYWGCIEWLQDSGIINICYCLNFPELPLKGNYDDSKFKIYFADTSMLIASLDDESQNDLRMNKNFGTYKGAVYENIVCEALRKSGAELFYYKRQDSTLEEDFFMRTASNLVPVEVKSTNGTAKSLSTLISSDKYPDISWGIKLVKGNIGFSNNILTIPYFCAFLLKRFMSDEI